jgi:hypothetical protein
VADEGKSVMLTRAGFASLGTLEIFGVVVFLLLREPAATASGI